MKSLKSVVVLSGGADSTTALHWAVRKSGFEVRLALFFDYGQRHQRERLCATHQAAMLDIPLEVVSLDSLQRVGKLSASTLFKSSQAPVPSLEEVIGDPQPSTYVPMRNMMMLTVAAAYAEIANASQIVYGAHKSDMYGYWDCSADFVSAMNAVLLLNRKHDIHIHAPFLYMTKAQIIALGTELGVDYKRTWSCYQGGIVACGECATCKERLASFEANDLTDPILYRLPLA